MALAFFFGFVGQAALLWGCCRQGPALRCKFARGVPLEVDTLWWFHNFTTHSGWFNSRRGFWSNRKSQVDSFLLLYQLDYKHLASPWMWTRGPNGPLVLLFLAFAFLKQLRKVCKIWLWLFFSVPSKSAIKIWGGKTFHFICFNSEVLHCSAHWNVAGVNAGWMGW
jgi:hypothetical protein